jgi:thiol-disulfide isomerase/thioredoxin
MMQRAIKLIILIGIIAIAKVKAQGNNDQSVLIKGAADEKYNGQFVHIYNRTMHDSALVENGKFTLNRPFKEPTIYWFYSSFELSSKQGYSPLGILMDRPSIIRVNADMESFANSKVIGSSANDIYNHFLEQIKPVEKKMMDTLYARYGKDYIQSTVDTSSEKYKSLMKEYNELSAVKTNFSNQILESTIRENPSSFASIVLLDENIRNLSLAKREQLYSLLPPLYKKGVYGNDIETNINGMKKSALGNTVDDFSLNDPKGMPMRFNSLKGKYVLIDFWGSWCGPCHTAFPALRSLYAKYRAKGFEILGIATETNIDAWVKDINNEKLPWPQMVDVQGAQSISQSLFAITQYPTAILIDPDGKIIGRFGDNGKTEIDRDNQLAAIFTN